MAKKVWETLIDRPTLRLDAAWSDKTEGWHLCQWQSADDRMQVSHKCWPSPEAAFHAWTMNREIDWR